MNRQLWPHPAPWQSGATPSGDRNQHEPAWSGKCDRRLGERGPGARLDSHL